MNHLLRNQFIVALFVSFIIQGCTSKSLMLSSYPSLYVEEDNEKKKIHKLNELNWVLSNDKLDILVDIDNIIVLKSSSEILTMTMSKQGSRFPNAGKKPFVITLGLRAKDVGYFLDITNANLFFQNEDQALKPLSVRIADKGEEIDCLLYKKKQLVSPLVDFEIKIPNKDEIVNSNNPKGWKCVKFIFDITVPEPTKRFRLMLGELTNEKENVREDLNIYFVPKLYESTRTQ